MKRPIKSRVWVQKPQRHWFGWRTLIPYSSGGDEWNWHTVVLGWTITSRVVFATRLCRGTGMCSDDINFGEPYPIWPEDPCRHPDYDDLFVEEG